MVRLIAGRIGCRATRMTGPKVFALRIIAAFVFALNFTAVSAGPLEDATAAERQDDYVTAIPIYRALAEKGVVKAYNRLGYLYYIGVGVKRDWVESAKWY